MPVLRTRGPAGPAADDANTSGAVREKHRGREGGSRPRVHRALNEDIRAGTAALEALRVLDAGREAEKQRIGRDVTPKEADQLYARDRLLAQAKAIRDFNHTRSALLRPMVTKQLEIDRKRCTALALGASLEVAKSQQRTHGALFAVSPMAWAIKKTWNGSPRRR
jgi:hypothetical protein